MRNLNPLEVDFVAGLRARRDWTGYGDDPVRFFVEVLGVDPWARQRDVLRAVATHRRVAVRSGHKVGKSTSAAGLALWWACTRSGARVVLTSASARQVKAILWRELRALHARTRVPIGGNLHVDPSTGLQFPDGREIVGFSTDEAERMQGISGAQLLFVVDEASGFPEPIFEAIEGNLAGGGKMILLGNPTRTSGTFYQAFRAKRDFWHPVHISSEETPNVQEGRIVIPGLATREWVEERRAEWGEDSPLYEVRVRGDFPSQAENAVVPLALVEDAVARWDETSADGLLTLGVDVARFGDDETVIFPVRGRKALSPKARRSLDAVQVAGAVLDTVRDLAVPDERPVVRVDAVGIGAGAADILRQQSGLEVIDVTSGERSPDEHHALVRDWAYFALRDWLRDGGAILADSKLEAELVAPTYSFDLRGRIKVEPKASIKARLGRSPDRADALMLAVAPVVHGGIFSTALVEGMLDANVRPLSVGG